MATSILGDSISDPLLPLKNACTICLVAGHKYKCPGCGTKTCSLVCSRRHKARTGCSGVRDVVAFVKKLDLQSSEATVSSDYNFLSNIQRTIRNRAALLDSDAQQCIQRKDKERFFKQALVRSAVNVKYVPKGFNRSKENLSTTSTASGKPRFILWTIEWLGGDGLRILTNRVDENLSVFEAYLCRQNPALGGSLVKGQYPGVPGPNSEAVHSNVTVPHGQMEGQSIHFFLKEYHPTTNEASLRPLRANASLKESLSGKTIVEYPTIYVSQEAEALCAAPKLQDGDSLNG